jgi:hypothetical protein
MLTSPLGKEISKEEGANSLIPSSTMLERIRGRSCVDIVVRVFRVTSTPGMAVLAWTVYGGLNFHESLAFA